MKFSAVILAGGQSRRMGKDKAFLQRNGQCLLGQQIKTIQELNPEELFISGRPEVDYGAFGCPILHDNFRERGPLAGIEQAFKSIHSPLLLVLAVDMPLMTAAFLKDMAKTCSENQGAVPKLQDRLQPLAAFYPKSAHHLALTMLCEGLSPVTHFVQLCLETGLLHLFRVSPRRSRCFANWNSPADVGSSGKG